MTKHILVVDDDPSMRETVELLLNEVHPSIRFADGGRQCLEELRAGFRGLILMDVMMPELNGWETIAAIVEEGLDDGNIFCMFTAVQDPEPRIEFLKEYVLDYIRKPFTSEELVAVVDSSLGYLT